MNFTQTPWRQRRLFLTALLRLIAYEARLSVSWLWLAPLVGVGCALFIAANTGTPHAQIPFIVEQILLLGVPLCGSWLSLPLLEREWINRTMIQVTLRRSWVLLVTIRLGLLFLCLMGELLLAMKVGLRQDTRYETSALLLTITISLGILVVLGYLAALLAKSIRVGFLVVFFYWSINLFAALLLAPSSALQVLLLFHIPDVTNMADIVGKSALLVLMSGAVLAIVLLLQKEYRLITPTED